MWWFTVCCWHLSLPSHVILTDKAVYMMVLPACEGMKQFVAGRIFHTIHEAFLYFPFHTARYIIFLIIFHFFRSQIHLSWCFQNLVFDLPLKSFVMRCWCDILMKSALKEYAVIRRWWLSCPDAGDGKNKTDLMRLIETALTSKLGSLIKLICSVTESFFLFTFCRSGQREKFVTSWTTKCSLIKQHMTNCWRRFHNTSWSHHLWSVRDWKFEGHWQGKLLMSFYRKVNASFWH